MGYHSTIKKNKTLLFTINMDRPWKYYAKINQRERKMPFDFTHMWDLKANKWINKKQTEHISDCCCSATQSCPTLCDPMNRSAQSLPVHHQFPELAQTHVHWVRDAIQPFHALLSPSPAFHLSQHQDLFQWVSSSQQVGKILELQLWLQSFKWTFKTDFL